MEMNECEIKLLINRTEDVTDNERPGCPTISRTDLNGVKVGENGYIRLACLDFVYLK
jgi:hypothetical protein